MRITINNINKALADAGINAELIKGKGYFYFFGDDVDTCNTTSVYVYRLTSFTIDQWVREATNLKAEHERSRSFLLDDAAIL
jgi:hypothetical protein